MPKYVCLLMTATLLSACRENAPESNITTLNNIQDMPEAMPRPGVTLVNYDRLGTNAATYDDVREAFGSPGSIQSSAEMGGKRTATYNWSAPNGTGRVVVIFENDRVISKSQFGLE